MAKKIVAMDAIVEINIAFIIFSGLILYAAQSTIDVTPHGATLTKKAPGISFGIPELKITYPINNKIIGDIISFKIDIDNVNLLNNSLV